MKIDAHHHFWRLDRDDYGWLTPDQGPLWRDFMPDDFAPLLAEAGVDKTILVQAAASEAETQFLLGLAQRTPFVAGVVGWLDFDAPDASRAVERAAATSGLLGLRPMVQDLPDPDWLAKPELDSVFQAIVETGLCFDALVRPNNLSALSRRLAKAPDLKIVIDHGAKPDIAAGNLEVWRDLMRRLARDTGAFCKLSGLVTQAAENWSVSDLSPYADALLESFGPHRLMWGSDWPVLNLNGRYRDWDTATDTLLLALSDDDIDRVRGGSAIAFYGLK